MTELRLLAAIALFRELYDNNKNIYDILAEFIRAGILLNSKWSFNSVECSQILEITFGSFFYEKALSGYRYHTSHTVKSYTMYRDHL